MPRFGRLLNSIWHDKDFQALDLDCQAIYFGLLAYDDISWCGVIDYMPRRLGKLSAELDPARLDGLLRKLAAGRFLVIDDEEDEILVRTFVRHDGILSQPNIVKGMVKDLSEVHSPMLRQVVISELARAHREDPDAAGWAVFTGRGNDRDNRWASHHGGLISEIVDSWTQPEPLASPLAKGSGDPNDEPSANSNRTSFPLSPNPLPLPTDTFPLKSTAENTAPEPKPAKDQPGARPDVDELCELLGAQLAEREVKHRITDDWRAQCRLMLDTDKRTPDQVRNMLHWLGTSTDASAAFWRPNVHSMSTFRAKYDKIREQRIRDSSTSRAGPARSDLRAQQAIDAGRQLAAMRNQNRRPPQPPMGQLAP